LLFYMPPIAKVGRRPCRQRSSTIALSRAKRRKERLERRSSGDLRRNPPAHYADLDHPGVHLQARLWLLPLSSGSPWPVPQLCKLYGGRPACANLCKTSARTRPLTD
jgi:hypothetical protein